MGSKRVSKGNGSDIQGLSTISERGSFQDKSMKSSRTPDQKRPSRGAEPQEDPKAIFKVAHKGEYGAPTIYTESRDSRKGGRGQRVK